jgi:GH15 family glucan-1,4-alpha-glucosidase
MCWATVDRAVRVADHFTGREQPEWATLRDRIAADVLEKGWKDRVGAYTAAYDGEDIDASSLAVGLAGLLPADDPRFLGTIHAVEEHLLDGVTVYRYLDDDGLPGREGGFNLMTSWLIDSYALVGRHDDAHALLDKLAALAGTTGLLSEEYDPESGRALGNHPQAYSHLGLINNAMHLAALSVR